MSSGGNNPERSSGSASEDPVVTRSCTSSIAAIIAELPNVSRTTRRACKIGIPAETRVPRVRVKRATATSRSRTPTIGRRSRVRSTSIRFCGWEIQRLQPMMAATVARAIAHHHPVMNPAIPKRTLVGKGSSTPGWPVIGAISRGSTNVISTTTLIEISPATIIG